ncbi:MAG: DUF4249 domain-containing protein [Bacteroidetes bacterium]|nr:DUF4249 domain-containing protein [Bacteroidota bacterium]
MKTLSYILILSILLSCSCRKVIEMDIPDKDKKIVLNCILQPDTTVSIHLSKSIGILDNDSEIESLNNAVIRLYENNSLLETLIFQGYGFYNSTFPVETGKTYRIEASYPGLHDVSAEAAVPVPIPVLSWDTLSYTYHNYDNIYDEEHEALQCRIRFSDPIQEDNYYMIGVTCKNDDGYGDYSNSIWFESEDPALDIENSKIFITDYKEVVIFDDEIFDGLGYTFNLYLFKDYLSPGENKLTFTLYTLPVDLYRYFRSYSFYQGAYQDPFAEKVQIFSNIENGFGIFGGYGVSEFTITVEGVEGGWTP